MTVTKNFEFWPRGHPPLITSQHDVMATWLETTQDSDDGEGCLSGRQTTAAATCLVSNVLKSLARLLARPLVRALVSLGSPCTMTEYGPQLPPGLRRPAPTDDDDAAAAPAGEVGPQLPPELRQPAPAEDTADTHDEFGPQMPPELRRPQAAKEDSNTFGTEKAEPHSFSKALPVAHYLTAMMRRVFDTQGRPYRPSSRRSVAAARVPPAATQHRVLRLGLPCRRGCSARTWPPARTTTTRWSAPCRPRPGGTVAMTTATSASGWCASLKSVHRASRAR